jgi:hypothetical protein
VTITPKPGASFYQLLAEAIADMAASGYVSRDRVQDWVVALRNAAERDLGPEWQIDESVKRTLGDLFGKYVDGGKILERVPGVTRFTLATMKPRLHAELDRRTRAAVDLIKLNRTEAVNLTLRRFAGWSTSVPPGGDETINRRETRDDIGKSIAQHRYEARRCQIDQGYKLVANIAATVATDGGAIAAVWHDHGAADRSYKARPEHMARNGLIYGIRDSWAAKAGLINKGAGWTDEIDAPSQAVSCRCWYSFVTSPRRLPDEMLTRAGEHWIERGREAASGIFAAA